MDSLIGLLMIYSWIHAAVIAFTKGPKERSTYETVIMCIAMGGFALIIIGIINKY